MLGEADGCRAVEEERGERREEGGGGRVGYACCEGRVLIFFNNPFSCF